MSGSFGTEILNLLLGLHISTYRRNFSQILQVLVIQGSEAPASTFCLPLILFSNDFGAINLHNFLPGVWYIHRRDQWTSKKIGSVHSFSYCTHRCSISASAMMIFGTWGQQNVYKIR